MSIQTKLSVLRRDDKINLSPDDINYINERKQSYEEEYRSRIEYTKRYAEEHKELNIDTTKNKPLYIPQFIYLDKYHYVCSKDNSVWTVIYSDYFLSSFTELAEHVNLTLEGNNDQYFFSKEEAKEIIAAIRYLTHKHYDDEIERIINSEYIHTLGSIIPSYTNRHNRHHLNLSFIKEDEDNWRIVDENNYDEEDNEYEKENLSILETVCTIMKIYLQELYVSTEFSAKEICSNIKLMLNYT